MRGLDNPHRPEYIGGGLTRVHACCTTSNAHEGQVSTTDTDTNGRMYTQTPIVPTLRCPRKGESGFFVFLNI